MKQARKPAIALHRARPADNREDKTMDSYRTQIIAMLDTVADAAWMRTLYEMFKLILMHVKSVEKMRGLYDVIRIFLMNE